MFVKYASLRPYPATPGTSPPALPLPPNHQLPYNFQYGVIPPPGTADKTTKARVRKQRSGAKMARVTSLDVTARLPRMQFHEGLPVGNPRRRSRSVRMRAGQPNAAPLAAMGALPGEHAPRRDRARQRASEINGGRTGQSYAMRAAQRQDPASRQVTAALQRQVAQSRKIITVRDAKKTLVSPQKKTGSRISSAYPTPAPDQHGRRGGTVAMTGE